MEEDTKILFIENDMHVRKYYEEALINSGFKVDTFMDTESGLKAAKDTPFKLILIDMTHSDISINTVVDKLKLTSNASTPVLVGLSLDQLDVLSQALKLGIKDSYIRFDPRLDNDKKVLNMFLEKVKYFTKNQ
ncbi:MAG: hypothetical protein M3P33_02945 [bacterium]|nr:hypothetical protein [bacterium]